MDVIILSTGPVDHSRFSTLSHGFECIDLNQFFDRFQDNASECLQNAYTAKNPIVTTREGKLISSLASEVFSLVNVQLGIMSEYILVHNLGYADAGMTFVIEVSRFIIKNLVDKQSRFRHKFFLSLESCCAASNDFFRMAELAEEWMLNLKREHKIDAIKRPLFSLLESEHKELVSIYVADAVYASQMAHTFVFEPIHESVVSQFFSREWEYVYTCNEIAVSFVKTIEDYLQDIDSYLSNEYLFKKMVDILIEASVVVYVKHLIKKAKRTRQLVKRKTNFKSPARAIKRIHGDIEVLKRFFLDLSVGMPALVRVIHREFGPLTAIYEFISVLPDASSADIRSFAFLLDKITGSFDLTRSLLGDLCHLFSPKKESMVYETVTGMKSDLIKMKEIDSQYYIGSSIIERNSPPLMRLDQMLDNFYGPHENNMSLYGCDPYEIIDSSLAAFKNASLGDHKLKEQINEKMKKFRQRIPKSPKIYAKKDNEHDTKQKTGKHLSKSPQQYGGKRSEF